MRLRSAPVSTTSLIEGAGIVGNPENTPLPPNNWWRTVIGAALQRAKQASKSAIECERPRNRYLLPNPTGDAMIRSSGTVRTETSMSSTRRDDMIWIAVVTVIAVTINPVLKSVGLLPADVFRNLGIAFPGQPQIVFGPLMAFLLLALFLKTGQAMVFPVIGFLRALSLSFVFPANVEHSGTLLAAFVAGGAAAMLLKSPPWAGSHIALALLAGVYAGLYAAFNYLSTVMFGPAAQTAVILGAPLRTIGIIVGSFVLGTLLGFIACWLMRPVQAVVFAAPAPRYGV
jgi:hypothetical protein